ncbi:hypothetical protein FS837_004895 [Tulasnella sp. UAMH 9824]|nr:hypothetical protein FS837_004895 [Tulasnella sp. UAMH 9824]
MSPVPAYILQLSTEEFLDIIDRIPSPNDILALSLTSKRFAEIIRDEWTWRRHLALGGWNVDAIIRHIQAGAESGAHDYIWIKLARAACNRWDVVHPGCKRGASQASRYQGWGLWKRVVQHEYIDKLPLPQKLVDSDDPFFEKTERIARFLASRQPDYSDEGELLSYRRLVVVARYMYHGKSGIAFVSVLFEADAPLASALVDMSLGKAFEPGYQQWPIIYSRRVAQRRDFSINNLVTEHLKGLFNSDDPGALRYVNLALILFMALLRDMIRSAANQSPQGIDYRRVFPQRSLPNTTWFATSSESSLPWIGPQGQSWWTSNNGTMVLQGYYAHRFLIFGDWPLEASMTMTLSRRQNSDEFRGEGQDGAGSFTITGTSEGAVVSFFKQYQGWRWVYSGILLPWALVGIWETPGNNGNPNENPNGDFCLWLVE